MQATLDPSKGRDAQRAFFVEKGTPGLGGFKIEKKMGLKAYESTSFSRWWIAAVPAAQSVGRRGALREASAGFKTAMRTFNAGRPDHRCELQWGLGERPWMRRSRFAREHDLIR